MSTFILLHTSVQYAECLLVNRTMSLKSYTPTYYCLLNKEIKFGLNITGYTTRRLLKNIIKLIRNSIGYTLIELTGYSYIQAIPLPII